MDNFWIGFRIIFVLALVYATALGISMWFYSHVGKMSSRLRRQIYAYASEYKFYENTFVALWGDENVKAAYDFIDNILADDSVGDDEINDHIDKATHLAATLSRRFDRLVKVGESGEMSAREKLEFIRLELGRHYQLSFIEYGVDVLEEAGRTLLLYRELKDFEKLQKSLPSLGG